MSSTSLVLRGMVGRARTKRVLGQNRIRLAAGINTVRKRLQQLEHPVPPSEIARITGISKATLIRRCNEGSLPHFRSRGMILLDPALSSNGTCAGG